MESVGGVVDPHFRRGYFKRLESDFYKNKKGQIIFVHETVVNAQAKRWSNIENGNNFRSNTIYKKTCK